jgi:hypothetical protein
MILASVKSPIKAEIAVAMINIITKAEVNCLKNIFQTGLLFFSTIIFCPYFFVLKNTSSVDNQLGED